MGRDIREWLEDIELGRLVDVFVEHEINFSTLPYITEEDLKEIGLKLGTRRRILAAINELKKKSSPDQIQPSGGPEAAVFERTGNPEKRHLTVMFCDLVGSTELSSTLDAEDLRILMRQYQDTVAGAVSRYGGHIAKYLGDGVLAYFGWPRAYEDQAERAIKAGLEAVSAVRLINVAGEKNLSCRVGVSSGEVIVGDLIGQASLDAEAVTGATPNLAARLQGIAEPGQVIISDSTRRLVGNVFLLHDLGQQNLKGFPGPIAAWTVKGERAADSRFEASHQGALSPFIGRAHELDLISERWSLAKQGEGQVVLLTGEAGMGKSRLVLALRELIDQEQHFRLRYQCSPHHVHSSFYPIIQRLEKAAGFLPEDNTNEKIEKLEGLLTVGQPDIQHIAPFFAALLSLPVEQRYGKLDLDPQKLRDRTIEVLLNQVVTLSAVKPVLFVLEDAHWTDPSTEALIDGLISRITDARVLVLITYRPNYSAPWTNFPHMTSITLNRLSRKQSLKLIAVSGGENLSDGVREKILDRSEGMPLFLEELTRSIVESGAEGEMQAIPDTLHASLMARLDRLAEAKEIAQYGAAIGREFSYRIIARLVDLDQAELTTSLSKLTGSGLLFQRGSPPDSVFIFKHALIQNIAYESLLREKRRELHLQISDVIKADAKDSSETEPEVLAHHLTEAGKTADAVPYWLDAAQRAASASAYTEAEELCKIAIRLTKELPETPQRQAIELKLLLLLGSVLMSTKGFAAPEVGEIYAQAHRLCQDIGDVSERFAATWGYWIYSYQAGAHERAKNLAKETIAITQNDEDTGRRLQAHHASWTYSSVTGDLNECQEHLRSGKTLYDESMHGRHAYLFAGHDPGVCCWNHAGMIDWVMGFPEDARKDVEKARQLADQISHPFSQMLSRVFSSWVYQHRRERTETKAMAEEAMAISKEHGFHQYVGVISIFDAWAHVNSLTSEKCLNQLKEGLAQFKSTGSSARLSYYLSVFADACLEIGEIDEGLQAIEEGLACVKEHDQARWEPELHRLHANLMLRRSAEEVTKAEHSLHKAVEIANLQGAKSWELRAAIDLAGLLKANGRSEEAQELLRPVFEWFDQGFDSADLIEANALLEELN
jgi:class 3 adenylate cyclase/predicted ATPase/energy-coupling factor transporter ATP-binding protein EcfA2